MDNRSRREEDMPDTQPEIITLVVGQLQTNCYLVICPDTHSALAIDPADEAPRIVRAAQRASARIEKILLTHTHLDHVWGLPALREATGATVLAHRLDVEMLEQYARVFGLRPEQLPNLRPDIQLEGGETISVGHLRGTIIHTPGHSPGSIALAMGNALFAGDTLFAQGVGRTDLPGGSLEQLLASIQRLFTLPEETTVYPGHGPATTIGTEKRDNPYV